MKNKSALWRGSGLALVAVCSFSVAMIFTKWGINLSQLDFYSLGIWGWGSGMVFATLIFYFPIKKQRQQLLPELKKHYRFFSIISALTIVNGVTWFYGMSQINGGVVALIDQNIIIWSFVLGALFLGERFSWQQLSAIFITLYGLFIISNLEGEVTTLGLILLLICGLAIALQSLFIKLYKKTFNALILAFWRGWSLVLISFLIWISLGKFQWNIEYNALFLLCIGQFFGLFVGRAAYIKAHEYLPISQLSFLMLGIPVIVLFLSILLLGEPVSNQKLLGAFIMLCGLTWFLLRRAKRQKA